MRSPDFWSALVWLAVGLGLAHEGWDLGLGELREPGSGFILFWIGIAMAALSVGVAVSGSAGAGTSLRVASLFRGSGGRRSLSSSRT